MVEEYRERERYGRNINGRGIYEKMKRRKSILGFF